MRRPLRLPAAAGILLLLGGCTLFGPPQPLGEAALARLGAPPVDLARPPAYEEVAALDRLGRTPAQEEAIAPAELAFAPMVPPAAATGPLRIGVEDAVLLALRNNRSLSVQQLQPVVSGTFEAIERAVFDPVLFAEGQLAFDEAQQTDRATGQLFSVRGDSSTISGGVRQTLPTGTDVAFSLQQRRTDSDRTPEQHATRAGVTLTQALLRGRGLEANLARIAQAELDTLASIYELRGFTEALVAEVESAYWTFVLIEREIEIFEDSLALARRQLADTERRIAVGLLPETEIAAARAEVARRQQGLIDVGSDLEQARLRLLRLLNPQARAGWERAIEVDDDPLVPEVALDLVEDHVALALRLRPDLNEARLRAERGRLEVVQTARGLLPVLDLFVTLGKSGFADSFTGAVGAIDEPGYDFTAGLRAEYPIGNRAARALDLRARTTRDQARIGLDNLAQLVSQDVRITRIEVDRARLQIDATTETRSAQEEVVRAEQAKFEAGTSTALLVAQAQRDLLEARINETRAVVAYRLAVIDLYRLEGSLLERRGITGPGAQPVQRAFAPPSGL